MEQIIIFTIQNAKVIKCTLLQTCIIFSPEKEFSLRCGDYSKNKLLLLHLKYSSKPKCI